MAKKFRRKLLFVTVFVCILMVTVGTNGSLICSAANQESFPESTAPEKTLTILEDVVGLDMAKYRTTLNSCNQDLYFESLPQESVTYTLESDESKLELICNFVNEKLRSMSVYELDSSPRMTQAANNMLEMTKDFINKYQAYSGASYYGTLRPMLENVETNKNVTKTSENVNLEVTIQGSYTSFRWTYTVNGVEAPSKCVALIFEQGFLRHFIDTWSLYKIGSTDINLSEEEAVKIAVDRANNFSWKVGGDNNSIEVTEFNIVGVSNTTLDFGNYISKKDARDQDPLTLYPGWRIKLYFDKLYPGNVYGVDVGIWADTGEVNDIYAMFLMGDYSSNGDANDSEDAIGQESNESNDETGPNLTQIAWIPLPFLIVIVLGATEVYSRRKRRISHKSHSVPKSNSLKLVGALLCLLILLTTFSMATPTVKGGTYVMPLYGSRAGMVDTEQQRAKWAIDMMEYYFPNYAGYTCFDRYGSQTQKNYVLSQASYLEQTYDHVAMFHHGHAGFNHYSYPLIQNGGFESGASYWTIGGYGDHRVTSEDRHSGSYSLLLGWKYSSPVADARDEAYQMITIPSYAKAAKFSFWYHLFTYDSEYYDWFEVYVAPVGGDPHLVFKKGGENFGGLEEYGWEQVRIDLSAYAGQSIYIYFAVANWYDASYKTWCYIDDVTYEVTHWDYFDDDWNIQNPSYNDEIYDYDVWPKTWRSKHFFVILWACRQGDIEGYYDYSAGKAVGMPYAWHRPVSSGDCFIGFKDASMPLSQKSEHYPYYEYYSWFVYFIYYLTVYHYTIIQALDSASIALFTRVYDLTELNLGFTADWPEYPGWPEMPPSPGFMKIWGNRNIRVY